LYFSHEFGINPVNQDYLLVTIPIPENYPDTILKKQVLKKDIYKKFGYLKIIIKNKNELELDKFYIYPQRIHMQTNATTEEKKDLKD